jgi:hypothetical protein
MIPKILIYNDKKYQFVKEYSNVILYKNIKTGLRECFTKYQLGLVKEKVKPEREANRGGMCKH